jgi:hypothetical protein
MNNARIEDDYATWELEYAIHRIHITRNQSGLYGQMKHNEDTGACVV